jgi:hypothetical protein
MSQPGSQELGDLGASLVELPALGDGLAGEAGVLVLLGDEL